MSLGLIGRKVGMTRVFTDDGASIPVTVLEVIPNRVTQIKTVGTDGYNGLQVTFGERRASQVATGVKAFVVPGSERVKKQAEAEGLDVVFKNAGFEWREAGCSMCLAMNPDKLVGRQISASSSNRNFKGRQGSSSGRTLLMSPVMVIAAAVMGKVTDVRELMG